MLKQAAILAWAGNLALTLLMLTTPSDGPGRSHLGVPENVFEWAITGISVAGIAYAAIGDRLNWRQKQRTEKDTKEVPSGRP
ncbi:MULTISPECIES: hypothetical protein [unclassified Streptomyces]|uniref:hypothetical protein n=1 Tax=unclassified Streptomyces TaxID=2593676 RepID=UPI002E19B7A9